MNYPTTTTSPYPRTGCFRFVLKFLICILAGLFGALFCSLLSKALNPNKRAAHYTPTPYAVLVSTNLVSQPCPCGFCDPSRGIRVPEHINQVGYDLRVEVSTNYLPIVYRQPPVLSNIGEKQ